MQYHPDFVIIPTASTWGDGETDYNAIGSELLTASELEKFRHEEREYSDETRRMLDEFSAIFDAIENDSADDYLADFDANEDRWFA